MLKKRFTEREKYPRGAPNSYLVVKPPVGFLLIVCLRLLITPAIEFGGKDRANDLVVAVLMLLLLAGIISI